MPSRKVAVLMVLIVLSVAFGVGIYLTTHPVGEHMRRENQLMHELTALGWVYVYEPRELFEPGALVSLSEQEGLRYRGHLRDCMPESVLVRRAGLIALPQLQREWSLSATGFARFVRIGNFGPAYQTVQHE